MFLFYSVFNVLLAMFDLVDTLATGFYVTYISIPTMALIDAAVESSSSASNSKPTIQKLIILLDHPAVQVNDELAAINELSVQILYFKDYKKEEEGGGVRSPMTMLVWKAHLISMQLCISAIFVRRSKDSTLKSAINCVGKEGITTVTLSSKFNFEVLPWFTCPLMTILLSPLLLLFAHQKCSKAMQEYML